MASVVLDSATLTRCVAVTYPVDTAVAVGVSCVHQPDVLAAVGLTPQGGAFSPHTIVYVGSLAKQITAACAALLVTAGQLSLDDTINTWLPELPPWASTIRVRHIIHHTGDLPSEACVRERMQRTGSQHHTSEGVLQALGTLTAYHPQPGIRYTYSNWGYVCLATIVGRLTGRPLAAFAQEQLFRPLGMQHTCYWNGPAPMPPGAVALPQSLDPAPHSLGDGGVWTTLVDLLRWNDALNTDAFGLTQLLHTPGHLDDGTPLDYAWGVRVFEAQGQRVQSHGGGWPGATAKLVRLPDQRMSIGVLALHDDIAKVISLTACVQQHILGVGACS